MIRLDSIEVQQAKKAVEARYGEIPNSPADFAELSLIIKQTTKKEVSPDTLSRLWGYKKGYEHVRGSVIEILRSYAHSGEESDFIYTKVIRAEEMVLGEQIRIAWLPDRVCVLEYLGDYRWQVDEVRNSKLGVGDTFSCRTIAEGQALVIDNLRTGNGNYNGYVIGGKNGLTRVEKVK